MEQFQTPVWVCKYMAAMLPDNAGSILEPTPGIGNLYEQVKVKGVVTAPKQYSDIPEGQRFDWVVMNPPFTPMTKGYYFLYEAMKRSDNIVALMPWLTIINSEKRTRDIKDFGLVSITHLERSVFKGSRVQCCILQMKKGFQATTQFHSLEFKPSPTPPSYNSPDTTR